MEVNYRRDLNHNYVVVESGKVTGKEYTVRMMEQNGIPEFLNFQLRKMNGKTYLYYEITSRQPLTQVYDTACMRSRDIEQILRGIQNVLERARQYLLDNADILLNPDFIYMNVETGKIQLCYVPFSGENPENSFLNLAEFILKRLDHGDRRAVDLGYALYGQATQGNFSLQETLKSLLQDQPKIKGQTPGEEEESGQDGSAEYHRVAEIRKGSPQEASSRDRAFWFIEENREEAVREEEESFTGRNGGFEEKDGKEESRKKKSKKQRKGKRVWVFLGAAVFLLLLFAAIVFWARLDLTQTGGLAFLFLAVLWIAGSAVKGRKTGEKQHWLEEEEEETEFERELYDEIYDDAFEEGAAYRKKGHGSSGNGKTAGTADVPAKRSEERTVCGETRCLTAEEYEKPLRLVSLEPEFYPDLLLNREKVIIGKKKEQVDLWLGMDCISRIHAKVEKHGEEYFLTDLNSMNGTFVNGERLRPKEVRQIYIGDKISFATLHYEIKGIGGK